MVVADDLMVDRHLVSDASGSKSTSSEASASTTDWVQCSSVDVGAMAMTPPVAENLTEETRGACEILGVADAMKNTALEGGSGKAVAFHPTNMEGLELMDDYRKHQIDQASESSGSSLEQQPTRRWGGKGTMPETTTDPSGSQEPETPSEHFASLAGATDFMDMHDALNEIEGKVSPAALEIRSMTVDELCKLYYDPDKSMGGKVLSAAAIQQERARQDWEKQREQARQFLHGYKPEAQSQEYWSDDLRRAMEQGLLNPRCDLTPLSLDMLVEKHKEYITAAARINAGTFSERLYAEVPDASGSKGMGRLSNTAMVKWLLTTRKGEWKMVSSQWVLKPGSAEASPWMENQHWPLITKENYEQLEAKTWHRKNEFSYGDSVPQFSQAEIGQQVADDLRPAMSRMLNPVLAVYEKDMDNWHYERIVTSRTLPSLFSYWGHQYAAKQLWTYYESLPTLKEAHIRGKKTAIQKAERIQQYESVKAKAKDFCEKHGITPPKTSEERSKLMRHMAQFLATTRFLTKNPDFIMTLPVVAGHDDAQTLQWRCTFDERLTFPIDALPIDIQEFFKVGGHKWAVAEQYWRCNSTIWWTESKAARPIPDASGSKGEVTVTVLSEAPPMVANTKPGHIPDSASSVFSNTDKGRGVWKQAECGMILSAKSQWRMTIRSKNNQNGVYGWACSYCAQNWLRKRNGSRFVVIYDGDVALQLILDEPPSSLWNGWIKERCEFYKRLEPRDDTRDIIPMLPQTATVNRIKVVGPASDAVWKVLYSNPEVSALAEVDKLAQTALRVEGALFVH